MPHNPPNCLSLAANLRRPGIEARSASADAEGRFTVDCYRGFVDRRTRILAVSWVPCGNGYRADLAELSSFCRERGIKSVVDGIQAVGVLAAPVSELGAHVVIAGGHEAQFGLAGAGFMYASPETIETVVPPYVAELSFASSDRALPELELAHDAHRSNTVTPTSWAAGCKGDRPSSAPGKGPSPRPNDKVYGRNPRRVPEKMWVPVLGAQEEKGEIIAVASGLWDGRGGFL